MPLRLYASTPLLGLVPGTRDEKALPRFKIK
jgi:hypothetical protein